jgi:NAD(P)-dependent dehydrogenase (short-subunit alcohol dehydrogenase family)
MTKKELEIRLQLAEKAINEQLCKSAALFYHIDLSDELQIDKLHSFLKDQYGFVDIVFNNATIAPLGAVERQNKRMGQKLCG